MNEPAQFAPSIDIETSEPREWMELAAKLCRANLANQQTQPLSALAAQNLRQLLSNRQLLFTKTTPGEPEFEFAEFYTKSTINLLPWASGLCQS